MDLTSWRIGITVQKATHCTNLRSIKFLGSKGSLYFYLSYSYDVQWDMMHAKDLGYQLVIGRNERWISNVWLIQSPVRVAGYFKCMPAFLGKIQWAAWCPQQLAPNSWQLLHLPLRRVPALHQGLVSCLNLPWRMTLMISKETVSKGTHVRHSKREKWCLCSSSDCSEIG